MDPREAEKFEEGLDSEYHNAAEEPSDTSKPEPEHMSCFFPTGVMVVHHCENVETC